MSDLDKKLRQKYYKTYYEKHKDEVIAKQREWRKNNHDKWIKSLMDSRTRRIERMRKEGITNPWGVIMRGSKPKYDKEV